MSKSQMSAESLRIQEIIKKTRLEIIPLYNNALFIIGEGFLNGKVEDLLNALKGNIGVKRLKINGCDWEKNQISLLANFFKDPEWFFTNIYLENNIHVRMFKIFKDNEIVEKIFLGDTSIKDEQLLVLLENLSYKFKLKELDLRGTSIELETKLIGGFKEFFKSNKLKRLNISNKKIKQENLIELLKIIKEKNNVEILEIREIYLDDKGIDVICSLTSKGSKMTQITFSLKEISLESKNKLLKSVQNNKAIVECKIFGHEGMRWYPLSRQIF